MWQERFAVTKLETLAVVLAINQFHAHLYGHNITVYTNHSAVKAVLETPSPAVKYMHPMKVGSGLCRSVTALVNIIPV